MPDEPGRRLAPGPGEVVTDPVAFMFPGQGSQRVGMWQELGAGSAPGERRLAEAQDRLGLPLRQLMDEGPDSALQQTEVAQPCLLLVDVVCAERLLGRGMAPVAHLGHSLGEYAALVLAGVLRFGDALQLVRERGRLMARAAELVPGGMAAVLGLEHEALEPLLTELRGDAVVEITNFNAPRQVVISGATAPVEAIVAAVNASRKGRAVMLNVSAPFHCSLMAPVAEAFRELVDAVEMRAPRQTFIDNVTGSVEQDPERIRRKLVEQIYRPVRWEQALHAACRLGVRTFVECGPGGVLTGLVKRAAPDAKRLRAADLLRAG
jgi:[acyl-carrier-protein] S-malonyltransferase